MDSRTGHLIKHRKVPDNEFFTPVELAKLCIGKVPLEAGDVVLDPAVGSGAFYDNFPSYVEKGKADIGELFLMGTKPVDWAITNPPYSNLDDWFAAGIRCRKGFAYLFGLHNLTPRRLELANKAGFGLASIYLCKVFEWYGISAFVVFQRGVSNILEYGRKVWRS